MSDNDDQTTGCDESTRLTRADIHANDGDDAIGQDQSNAAAQNNTADNVSAEGAAGEETIHAERGRGDASTTNSHVDGKRSRETEVEQRLVEFDRKRLNSSSCCLTDGYMTDKIVRMFPAGLVFLLVSGQFQSTRSVLIIRDTVETPIISQVNCAQWKRIF